MNSEQIELTTIRGKHLKYKVNGNNIFWIPLEPTMRNLYNQSKGDICNCLIARENSLNPSFYPGTAQSYKWALLNNPIIWL